MSDDPDDHYNAGERTRDADDIQDLREQVDDGAFDHDTGDRILRVLSRLSPETRCPHCLGDPCTRGTEECFSRS